MAKAFKIKFPECRELKRFPDREFWFENNREIPGSGFPDIGIDFTKDSCKSQTSP